MPRNAIMTGAVDLVLPLAKIPDALVKYGRRLTISRKQDRNDGYPDVTNTYTYHVWVRNSDRAAMKRRVFRDNYEYPPEFDRPAFNEARDPGPPTADIFEPKPVRPHPASEPRSVSRLRTGHRGEPQGLLLLVA